MSAPLKPGERVRVYGGIPGTDNYTKFGGAKGTVVSITPEENAVTVRFDKKLGNSLSWNVYRPQCRRLKRKPKPEGERQECWVCAPYALSKIPPLHSGVISISRAELVGKDTLHLVEVREGERVLSRKELAKAWDKHVSATSVSRAHVSGIFSNFIEALGFKEIP